MTYQVKSFKVLQTSAMVAVLYFLIALLIAIPLFLISLAVPEQKGPFAAFGSIFFVLMPFIYAIIGFIFTALGCLIYNLVAKFMGGMAFSLEEIK